jgi:hypothetical protein
MYDEKHLDLFNHFAMDEYATALWIGILGCFVFAHFKSMANGFAWIGNVFSFFLSFCL